MTPHPLSMSESEASELHRQGYSTAVICSLRDRGFRPCGPDPDDRSSPRFLRQTTLPHLLITLTDGPASTLEDIDTAIASFGAYERHQRISDHWHKFTNLMKGWPPGPNSDTRLEGLEIRLAKIEKHLTAPHSHAPAPEHSPHSS